MEPDEEIYIVQSPENSWSLLTRFVVQNELSILQSTFCECKDQHLLAISVRKTAKESFEAFFRRRLSGCLFYIVVEPPVFLSDFERLRLKIHT